MTATTNKFYVERSLRNAISWAKKEWLKYGLGNYHIDTLAEVAASEYYLRDEEVQYLRQSLYNFYKKRPFTETDSSHDYYLRRFKEMFNLK